MRKLTGIVILLLCCCYFLSAQEKEQKIKIYKTWVSFNNVPFNVKGVLYEVKDSSILVSNSLLVREYTSGRFKSADLHINTIEKIRIRKKNKVGKAALIGGISGFVIGAIIGYAEGDDPPCSTGYWGGGCESYTAGQKALINGASFAIVGGGIGALVGLIKIKIPINGNIENFNNSKNRLKEYSIKK